jgi:hypothetical protein
METLVIPATDDEAADPLVELRERRGGEGVVVRVGGGDPEEAAPPPVPAAAPPPPRTQAMNTEQWLVESSKALVDSLAERTPAPAAPYFADVLAADLDEEEAKHADRERAADDALLALARAAPPARATQIAAERARLFKDADARGKAVLDLAYRCSEKIGAAAGELRDLEARRADTLRELADAKARLTKLAAGAPAAWADPIRRIVDEEESSAREQLEADVGARVAELRKFKLVRLPAAAPTATTTPHLASVVDARERQYAVHATRNVLASLARHGGPLVA